MRTPRGGRRRPGQNCLLAPGVRDLTCGKCATFSAIAPSGDMPYFAVCCCSIKLVISASMLNSTGSDLSTVAPVVLTNARCRISAANPWRRKPARARLKATGGLSQKRSNDTRRWQAMRVALASNKGILKGLGPTGHRLASSQRQIFLDAPSMMQEKIISALIKLDTKPNRSIM